MTGDMVLHDPKQWRSWSATQRQECLHYLRIVTPQMQKLWNEFERAVQWSRRKVLTQPYCQVLMGCSFTGKTCLVQMWRERVAPDVPSLYMSIRLPNSLSHFIIECLSALGDPQPWQGTTEKRAWRLIESIKAREIQIIFLDAVDQLVDKTRPGSLSQGSEDILSFLLQLYSDLGLPLVLIGLPAKTERLLQVSPKLGSRIQASQMLKPYAWKHAQPETIRDFCSVMDAIDQALPLDRSDLGTEAMAYRFFVATQGILGTVMRLVGVATQLALEAESPTLTLEVLAQAYDQLTARVFGGREDANPFSGPISS